MTSDKLQSDLKAATEKCSLMTEEMKTLTTERDSQKDVLYKEVESNSIEYIISLTPYVDTLSPAAIRR